MPDKWTTISNEFNRINEVGREFENQEAYRDYLKNALGQGIPGEMMELFIRDYVFDPDEEAQDEAQRAERRALSAQAREKWMNALLLEAAQPDSAVSELLRGGAEEKKADFIYDRYSNALSTVIRASEMSDRELVDNFEDIYKATRIVRATDEIKNTSPALAADGKLTALLREGAAYEEKADSILKRTMRIGEGVYEYLGPKELEKTDFTKLLKEGSDYMKASAPLQEYIKSAYVEERNAADRRAEALQDYFNMSIPEGETARVRSLDDGHDIWNEKKEINPLELLNGKPVAVERPRHGIQLYAAVEDAHHNLKIEKVGELEPLFRQEDVTQLGHLESDLKDVDPRYIISSDSFKKMKKALEKTNKEFKKDGDTLSAKDRESLKTQMGELWKSARAYLRTKDDLFRELEDSLPENQAAKKPRQEEKRSSLEKSRIEMAQRIMDFASKKLTAITNLEEKLQNSPASNIRHPEKKKAAETQAKAAEAKQPEAGTVRQVAQGHADRSAINIRISGDIRRKQLFANDPDALKLYEDTQQGLSNRSISQLLATGEFSPEQEQAARHQMARMIGVRLLGHVEILNQKVRERGEKIPAEANLLSEKLKKVGQENFIKSIEENDIFKEMTQNMTPQSFSHFIAENGDRTIAKQMVRQAKKDTTKKEKENVQQKKAESKKSKNKTNSSTKNKAGARL